MKVIIGAMLMGLGLVGVGFVTGPASVKLVLTSLLPYYAVRWGFQRGDR